MPRVISHTPSWLSHPAPGARIFSDPEAPSPASPSKKKGLHLTTSNEETSRVSLTRPQRSVAHRGSEVFTVVGNKIRWADLTRVRDSWEEQNQQRPSRPQLDEQHAPATYRTLKTPVYYQITNLTVSPSGRFLAISTEHTVHVAALPDSSRLHEADRSEIKLKTFQIGPTIHVIPEAPLASVLWHPYAASSMSTDCLVTVTTESAVRVWEFDRSIALSFERPALAIDLRKLADGTSSDQDFEPLGFGKSRGFSVDAFDMEASAACFGGRGSPSEDPWAPMTLWVAMTNGDIYALCPLLPETWRPGPTTIPALTTSAVAKVASTASAQLGPDEKMAINQQYEWVRQLDGENIGFSTSDESDYIRPSNPSAIPRLQGPFELQDDYIGDDVEVADILVIPANLDEDDLYSGEDDYEILSGARSLPFSLLCLTTSNGHLRIMLELEGVTGQWLPKHGRGHFSVPTATSSELVLLEATPLLSDPVQSSLPLFTIDPANSYAFYVTTSTTVSYLSVNDWAARVGSEVSEDASDGLQSRLALACQGSVCSKHDIITQNRDLSNSNSLSAAILIEDADLGSLILTSNNGRAVAAQLDQSSFRTSKLIANDSAFAASTSSPFRTSQSLMRILKSETNRDPVPARAPYAPAQIFYRDQAASLDELKSRIPTHRRSMLGEKPLRLSPACLDVVTLAHRTFSHQTSTIEKAAGELFRRCLRLREELADQVKAMTEIATKLHDIDGRSDETGKSPAESRNVSDNFTARIEAAKARQEELFSRYERVRRKAGQTAHAKQELSINEKTWISEVSELAMRIGQDEDANTENRSDERSLAERTANAKALANELLSQARSLQEQKQQSGGTTSDGKTRSSLSNITGMSRFQRERVKEVMDMVERESAVIEAVQGRLARMSIIS